MGAATNPSYTTVEVGGEIDAAGEETFWDFQVSRDGGATWEETQGSDVSGSSTGSAPEPVAGTIEGLRAGTTYEARLQAVRFANGFEEFNSAPGPPFTTGTLPAQTVTVDPVAGQAATAAHFVGHIDPNAPAGDPAASTVHWHFHCEPITCPSAEDEDDPEPVSAGSTDVEVHADATGLEPNTAYEVSLITMNDGGGEVTGGPVSFSTAASAPSAATIPAFALAGGTQAQLGGRVNPHNSPTDWWIEWGPTSDYGNSTPHTESAGFGGADMVEAQQVGGLSPDTSYHFRLVAKNDTDEIRGEDMTFTTPLLPRTESCPNEALRVGSSAGLSDCRAYELVSPSDLGGSSVRPLGDTTDPALPEAWSTVSADGDAALWLTATGVPGAPDASGFLDAYRSVRGEASWQSAYVFPPSATGGQSTTLTAYASPDVRHLLFQTFNATIDPSDGDPLFPVAPTTQSFGDLYSAGPDGVFDHVNQGSPQVPALGEAVTFVGASANLEKVVFASDRELIPGAPPGGGIYQSDGPTTRLVSKDETGLPFPGASTVRAAGTSADGSTVVFTDAGFSALYVWSEQTDQTVRAVSAADIKVDSVSADGRYVLFTTPTSLTGGDTDNSVDLYRYDTVTQAVMILSAPPGGTPAGNSDTCSVPLPGGAGCDVSPVIETRDGSSAYFVSPEQIVPGEGIDGGINLFLESDGEIRFVATLEADDPVFGLGGARARHVRLTPDAGKLLFESRARLTGYDNAGHLEVYLFDPASDVLRCASCRPDGAPSTGDSFLALHGSENSSIFGAAPLTPANADRTGGRIFFNSFDPIVPADANARSDVYEYAASTAAPALVSGGTSASNSAYVGNGVDGRDVFFVTTETLTPQDRNGNVYKLYDARVGGGFPSPATSPPPCRGDGCQGPGSQAPLTLIPGSSTLHGPGNVKPTRKVACLRNRRARDQAKSRCARKHRKHPSKKRHPRHHRRAGR